MRTLLALAAIACVLLCSACGSVEFWGIRTAEQANGRARSLRADAGGLRKEARTYEILMGQGQLDIDKHLSTIQSLTATRDDRAQEVAALRRKRSEAAGEDALALDHVVTSYSDKVAAVQAQIDD